VGQEGNVVELAVRLLQRLGGPANVVRLEPCRQRLRLQLADPSLMDVAGLKAMGVRAVVITGRWVQLVLQTDTRLLAAAIDQLKR
jgi:phosphotransferase system IIB component